MKVIIEAGVFHKDRVVEHHADLLGLFADCVRGRHTIAIDPSGTEAYRKWLDGEGSLTRELCKQVLQKSVKLRVRQTRTREIRVADLAVPSWPDRRLPLRTALGLLRRPLCLLLENARNDANFLRAVTRLAPDFNLDRLIDERLVEVHTKGGIDETRKWLETNGSAEDVYRTWVMCDSDTRRAWLDDSRRRIPDRLATSPTKLENVCRKLNITLHILQRRAIDNYVPLELLKDWSYLGASLTSDQPRAEGAPPRREERHGALSRLTYEQRYHYNMKDGFQQDEKDAEYAKKVGDLYQGLDPEIRRTLQSGFNSRGFGIADLFDETKIHDNLRNLRVHEAYLRRDNQEEEARRIAEAIQELL